MSILTRADRNTSVSKREVRYSDFLTNFDLNPITDELSRATNEEAVKQSIRNLILTAPGERPYQPDIGSGIKNILFEPMDEITSIALTNEIKNTINNHEPRANLEDVSIIANEIDQSYYVNILFSMINSTQVSQMSFVLNKVR
jgi:phage baseplate assembly protein W